jgi:holliday junction DNA helicase RuvA
MLGYVQGNILSIHHETQECVVQAGEVGYEIHASKRTLDQLTVGQFVTFWIHTHVREDIFVLYGFLTDMEKHFFRVLVAVQGLGPKTALALLGEHGVERLANYILNKNYSEITSAPGVGKKLAERLVLELSSKIEKLTWLSHVQRTSTETKISAASPQRQLRDDLASALTHLGYVPNQIKTTLDKLFETRESPAEGFEALLRVALQDMSGVPPREITAKELPHG